MIEVKYDGDLDHDIKVASDDLRVDSNLINKLIAISAVFGGLVLAGQNLNFLMFLDFLGGFVVVELIVFGFYLDKCYRKIWNAKKRISDLNLFLEKNDILDDELELLNGIKLKRWRIRLKKEDAAKKLTFEQKIVKYWSFLDRNDQIQILKYIRYNVVNSERKDVNQRMFLLEEKDKNSLSKSLKRKLKLYK